MPLDRPLNLVINQFLDGAPLIYGQILQRLIEPDGPELGHVMKYFIFVPLHKPFFFQLFQGASLLSIVMTPFYMPASLISLGGCNGYAIPGFVGLHPCLL